MVNVAEINPKTLSRVMAELARKRADSLTPKRRREIARLGGLAIAGRPRKRAKRESTKKAKAGTIKE